MIVNKKGLYRVLSDFETRNPIAVSRIKAGDIIEISQVDAGSKQVIGPGLMDWHYWELPVVEDSEIEGGKDD